MKTLENIKELYEKASPIYGKISVGEDFKIMCGKYFIIAGVYGTMHDVRYVAAAIKAVPALIELVEALESNLSYAHHRDNTDIFDTVKEARAKIESLEV